MSVRTAVVTGALGQDGALLSSALLGAGYSVVGTRGKRSSNSVARLEELSILGAPKLSIVELDLEKAAEVIDFIQESQPELFFNLASHSFVADSSSSPEKTSMVSAVAVVNTLEAISKVSRKTRFFQAGSSEMFGDSSWSPQNEQSIFSPRNVYGSAKVFAHHVTENYRGNAGLFAATGILYNHESPLRAQQFVTRKISSSVAKISLGMQQQLNLGNLSAIRDWGYAPEYVVGMKQILDHSEPDTFVLATGRGASVREFARLAFQVIGVEVKFEGEGLEERGFDERTGRTLVSVDPTYFRPSEEVPLIGDASKAKKLLGWEAKTQLDEIVRLMVESDIRNLANTNA